MRKNEVKEVLFVLLEISLEQNITGKEEKEKRKKKE